MSESRELATQEPRLLHYNVDVLGYLPTMAQMHSEYELMGKPHGTWVSPEGPDDWAWWCEREQFNLEKLAVATQVVLKPDARIVRITTDTQLRQFAKTYPSHIRDSWPKLPSPFDVPTDPGCVDWVAVAEEYQGIIIAPYQWGCRLDWETHWYYGWDCASGCIWDNEAVADLIPTDAGRAHKALRRKRR